MVLEHKLKAKNWKPSSKILHVYGKFLGLNWKPSENNSPWTQIKRGVRKSGISIKVK